MFTRPEGRFPSRRSGYEPRTHLHAESISVALARRGRPLVGGHRAQAQRPTKALRVVCVGAHPDDPESGCGGTLARYAALSHHVSILYLTRGERGIEGKSLDEAAAVRTGEAAAACKILAARPLFAGRD